MPLANSLTHDCLEYSSRTSFVDEPENLTKPCSIGWTLVWDSYAIRISMMLKLSRMVLDGTAANRYSDMAGHSVRWVFVIPNDDSWWHGQQTDSAEKVRISAAIG